MLIVISYFLSVAAWQGAVAAKWAAKWANNKASTDVDLRPFTKSTIRYSYTYQSPVSMSFTKPTFNVDQSAISVSVEPMCDSSKTRSTRFTADANTLTFPSFEPTEAQNKVPMPMPKEDIGQFYSVTPESDRPTTSSDEEQETKIFLRFKDDTAKRI